MVEMAIVLPMLILLTLGLIEYGWLFYKISQVNMAARHGVRTAVRPDATEEMVQAAVEQMMSDSGMKQSQSEYVLTYAYTPAGGTPTPGIAAAVSEPVTVHISVDYSKLTLTGTSLLPVPSKVQGRGTMVKEGPPPSP